MNLTAFNFDAILRANTLIDKSYYASLAVASLLTDPFTHMEEDWFLLGLEAYQNKDYAQAIELLQNVAADQWDAQLYLGMSYYMAGRHLDARKKFAHMRDNCPVTPLREKALSAYLMVHSKIQQSEHLKKQEDELTVEW